MNYNKLMNIFYYRIINISLMDYYFEIIYLLICIVRVCLSQNIYAGTSRDTVHGNRFI